MTPEQLQGLIDVLVRNLGPTGEKAFALALAQNAWFAQMDMRWALGLAIAAAILLAGIVLVLLSDNYDKEFAVGFMVAGVLVLGLSAALVYTQGAYRLANPELAAIMDLVGHAR